MAGYNPSVRPNTGYKNVHLSKASFWVPLRSLLLAEEISFLREISIFFHSQQTAFSSIFLHQNIKNVFLKKIFLLILKQEGRAWGWKSRPQVSYWMDYSMPFPKAGSQNLWLIGQGNGKSLQYLIFYSELLNFSSYLSSPESMKHTDGFWLAQSV